MAAAVWVVVVVVVEERREHQRVFLDGWLTYLKHTKSDLLKTRIVSQFQEFQHTPRLI